MNNRLATHYARFVDTYWFFPSLGHWRGIEAAVLSEWVEEILVPPMLDIGCGDGLLLKGWRGDILTADVGLDLMFKYVSRASRSGVYRHNIVADATEFPFVSNYYATVFSNSTLEHIVQLESVLGEAYRVLSPGGRFIFTVPNQNLTRYLVLANPLTKVGLIGLAQRWANRRNRLLGHRHLYSATKWQILLRRKGFVVEAIKPYLSARSAVLWEALRDLDWGLGQYRLHLGLKYLGYSLDKAGLNIPRRLVVWLMLRLCLPHVQHWEAIREEGACWLVVAMKPERGGL